LATARLVVYASPGYLTENDEPQHPADLGTHNCIIDKNNRDGERWPFVVEGQVKRIQVHGPLSVNSAMATRALVLAGKGIGLCPSFVVGDDLRQGRLKQVLKRFEGKEIGIYAIYPQSRHLAPQIRVLIDFLAGKFRGLLD
jgi:DNA-binding transcriptional LysR family regulator